MQLVNFPTWSRTINNVLCSSILDHIYIKDPTLLTPLIPVTPSFGDHILIMFSIGSKKSDNKELYKRNWKTYSKNLLLVELAKANWQIQNDDVQSYWNQFESTLIEIVDHLVPLEKTSTKCQKETPPQAIKTKINRRNRLIKKLKQNINNPNETRHELKTLNKEIKYFFHKQKIRKIRNGILPGNSKSLWNAVKVAKDINVNSLPYRTVVVERSRASYFLIYTLF